MMIRARSNGFFLDATRRSQGPINASSLAYVIQYPVANCFGADVCRKRSENCQQLEALKNLLSSTFFF
jgi:hypothetical protein